MRDIENTFALVKNTYRQGRLVAAKELLDELINDSPISEHGFSSRFLRARGLEFGRFGAADLDGAFNDYSFLRDNSKSYRNDGLLGCARVLFAKDAKKNIDEVILLCNMAGAEKENTKAMMFLGSIYENHLNDPISAAKLYKMAFLSGSVWGLRYYSRLCVRQKNYIRGLILHIVTTIISPVWFIFKKEYSPF